LPIGRARKEDVRGPCIAEIIVDTAPNGFAGDTEIEIDKGGAICWHEKDVVAVLRVADADGRANQHGLVVCEHFQVIVHQLYAQRGEPSGRVEVDNGSQEGEQNATVPVH
jgi:hypothetical protein